MNMSTASNSKPLPQPSDLSRPFWEGARRGELMIQYCAGCDEFQHPPRPQCARCWNAELEWRRCNGKGTVYTCTVAHRPTTPGFREEVPYSVAIVELDEGPRLTTNIVGCPAAEVHIGQRVEALFENVSPDVTLVKFQPERLTTGLALNEEELSSAQHNYEVPERQFIRAEIVDQHILLITIDRPEARNAFNSAMARQLEALVDRFDTDEALWVAVIRGEGGTFCAGQDLKAAAAGELAMAPKRGPFGIMERPPLKPLIAALEGHALAGGFELALSCDLIVATSETVFGLTEVRRGIYAAGGGCFRLPRRIPHHLAMEMVLTAEPQTAARLHEHGLVNRIAEPGQACEVALALARQIASNSPIGVRTSKEVVWRSAAECWTDAAGWKKQAALTARVVQSADMREGLRAFAEKREPRWRNC